MSAVIEYVKSKFSSKPQPEPKLCIYEERIKCFQKLAEIQKNLQSTDNEYVTVSVIEGKAHENAWNRMELHTAEYKKEYELCEKIMKY
jgi:hypothetical protein